MEPDPGAGGLLRWVVPPPDPCQCTRLVYKGGVNKRAPSRSFPVTYLDGHPSALVENATKFRWLLRCPGESWPHFFVGQ